MSTCYFCESKRSEQHTLDVEDFLGNDTVILTVCNDTNECLVCAQALHYKDLFKIEKARQAA